MKNSPDKQLLQVLQRRAIQIQIALVSAVDESRLGGRGNTTAVTLSPATAIAAVVQPDLPRDSDHAMLRRREGLRRKGSRFSADRLCRRLHF